ncbi:MAG: hypothetical protein OQL09_08145 [Gammaproteobacteria bacterium]|nr:hypothetical protein [Gammaproteobacteria bacterium]
MSKFNLVLALFFVQLISACSPHPASGQWHNIAIGDGEFTIIDVMFDGKAEMYATNEKLLVRRCFWAGVDSKTINLTCVHPDNTDTDIKYQLQISASQATLQQAGQTIASFRKQ